MVSVRFDPIFKVQNRRIQSWNPLVRNTRSFKTHASKLSTAIPNEILNQIDYIKPLANSINLYDRHVAVSTGTYTITVLPGLKLGMTGQEV